MAAAIALAIVLIIAVAGMSLAMQTQRPAPGQASRPPRPTPITPRRVRERRPAPPPPPPVTPAVAATEPTPKVPELLRSGVPGDARVVTIVDERVVGPVTRSRLTLRIDPAGEDGFEVTIRHAFPTPDARQAVQPGRTVAVRYDREDHHKVILDPERGSGRG